MIGKFDMAVLGTLIKSALVAHVSEYFSRMVEAINQEVNPKHSIMVELKSLDSSWGGQCWGLFFLAVKQQRPLLEE